MPKIDAINVTRGACPLTRSVVVPGRLSAAQRHFILVEVYAEGQVGIGLLPSWDEAEAVSIYDQSLAAMPALIDQDPLDTDECYHVFGRALGRMSDNELHRVYSQAAVDVALWDLKGKILQRPIWRMIGESVPRVPGYASGCWFDSSPQEVAEEASLYRDAGFSAIKMRVGLKDLAYDLARIEAVRNVFAGSLMLEAATIWHIGDALRAIPELISCELFWIEDPFPMGDTENLRRLKSTGLPLAGGEWAIGTAGVERVIDAHLYDYLILDLFRVGGVTPWRSCCSMAVSSGYRISSHVNTELSVQLLCGLEGSLYAEVIDLGEHFFSNQLRVEDGFVIPPNGPGLGLEIDHDYLDRFKIKMSCVGNVAARRDRTSE